MIEVKEMMEVMAFDTDTGVTYEPIIETRNYKPSPTKRVVLVEKDSAIGKKVQKMMEKRNDTFPIS